MGVDLFFVLSGFLVSGILFTEYKRTNRINIGRFFIRRGFKIYPLFYTTLAIAIVLQYLNINHLPQTSRILSEVFFLQSYVPGLINVTWSLAVEEHFYIILMVLMWWVVAAGFMRRSKIIYGSWVILAVSFLLLRFIERVGVPFDPALHQFPTHLRLDSLLAGVIISYAYHFDNAKFEQLLSQKRSVLWLISLGLISIPLYVNISTVFMTTIGFTLIYVGFGLLLSLFITSTSIDKTLDMAFTKYGVDGISKIGFYSYGIYLWHSIILVFIYPVVIKIAHIPDILAIRFSIYAAMGIAAGMVMSMLIEQPALRIRDRLFPNK